MVTLPSLPDTIPQVREPTPRVSAADVAAPYQMLAANLNKAGEVIGRDIAEPLAEKAGYEAVTRDDSGNLVVQKAPIVGPASEAYARAARFTYLAQKHPEIEADATKLRLQFPSDPEGFKTAWGAYTKRVVEQQTDPLLKAPLQKIAATVGGQDYRSALVEADHLNVRNALTAYQSRLADLNEQGASLARQGGTATADYEALHASRMAIYNELTKDKRFNYPQERADRELAENRDDDVVQGVIGQVQREYQTKRNAAEAKQALQDAFWGPGSENLRLSARQRDRGVAAGLAALANVSAEDRLAIAENRQATAQYIQSVQGAPAAFDPIRHNSLVEHARSIGDLRGVADLEAARIMQPVWASISGLSDADRTRALDDLRRGIVPRGVPTMTSDQQTIAGKIVAEAQRQGVDPVVAQSIGWLESRFDPMARPLDKASGKPLSSATGLFQVLHGERDSLGLPAKEREGAENATVDEQIAAGIRKTKANVTGMREFLGRDPTPTEVYLAHYQGLGGAKALLKAGPDANLRAALDTVKPGWGDQVMRSNPWIEQNGIRTVGDYMTWLDQRTRAAIAAQGGNTGYAAPPGARLGELIPGQPIAMTGNPAVVRLFASTAEALREQLRGSVNDAGRTIVRTLTQTEDQLGPTELQDFIRGAAAAGADPKIITEVEQALAAREKARGILQEGGASGAVEAFRQQAEALKASGIDPVRRGMVDSVLAQVNRGTEAMKKDPLLEGAVRGWIEPINPIATDKPDVAALELADRQKKIGAMRQRDPTLGAIKAIGDAEGEQVKTALTQGDPQQAAGLVTALGQALDPDTWRATMSSKPMREALTGMIRSRDPVRMTAGFGAVDRMWRLDEAAAEKAFGADAITHLHAWQGLRLSFSSAEIAERINRPDDPAVITARTKLGELAMTEMSKWTPGDVAYNLGTGWPGIGRLTGATPAAPADAVTAQVLLAEYGSTYKALRTYGVDADQAQALAAKRLGSTWGVSEIAGNQLMKLPPEKYYDAIGGSRAWMAQALETYVSDLYGPRISRSGRGGAVITTNWTLKGIVADDQTEAEIRAGRPPSYMVMIEKGGRLEAVTDNRAAYRTGPIRRFAWDNAPELQAARQEFEARRGRVEFMRENTGLLGSIGGF